MLSSISLIAALVSVAAAGATKVMRDRLRKMQDTTFANDEQTLHLRKSPSRLDGLDLLSLAFSIITKYIPGTAGYSARLRPDATDPQRFALPALHLQSALYLDERDLACFRKAVRLAQTSSQTKSTSSDNGDDDVASNGLLLVALTAPIVVYILAQHACPVKPLGAVNTGNTFVFLDPAACRDVNGLQAASQAGHLAVSTQFGGPDLPGVRKKRGMEFAMTIVVLKEGKPILEQRLSFLQFLPLSTQPRYDADAQSADATRQSDTSAKLETASTVALPALSTSSPRLWAASCGDYNPIHVSSLAAKLFGFPSVIAHGNHVVALALEALRQTDDSGRILEQSQPYGLDVHFVKPMTLPARLTLAYSSQPQSQSDNGSFSFRVNRGERACVTGSLYPVETGT